MDRAAEQFRGFERELGERSASVRERWRADSWLRVRLPQLLAVGIFLYYFIAFERLVWMRHANFGTYDYDLGIYDQAVWLLSRGRGFMTVRGMQVFGHHGNLGFYLFVPFYWVGAGPQFLNFMNTLAVSITAVPIYLLGRHHLKSDWVGLGVGVAYLFHFVPQWLIEETFHPESLAMPFLAAAFYFATIRKGTAYWWCILGALIWKEDVSLAVIGLGVLVAFMFGQRRRGLLTALAGGAWFLLITKVMLPIGSPGGAVFDSYFGAMGATSGEVAVNSIRHPMLLGRTLSQHKAEQGAIDILRAQGFVALAAPHVLLIGLPQFLINYISIQGFTWNVKSHYFTLPYVAAALAAVRSIGTRSKQVVSVLLVLLMLVAVGLTREQGVGPWTTNADEGYWVTSRSTRFDAVETAMSMIPDDASVSTRYYIVPHMAHRSEIYTYPNPWVNSNYGPGGKGGRSPRRIEYLLMTTENLSKEDLALFTKIVGSGEFREDYRWGSRGDEVLLYQRVEKFVRPAS